MNDNVISENLPSWADVTKTIWSSSKIFLPVKKIILKHYYLQRYFFLLKLIKKEKYQLVLDIGCDVGNLSRILTDTGKRVVGLDMNISVIDKSVANDVICAYAPNFTFTKSSFDLIIALGVTEHIEDEELFVKEIYHLLKEGGYYVCTIPIEVGFSGFLRHVVKRFIYNKREDSKSFFDYSIDEWKGKTARKKHGIGHKHYNFRYLLEDLDNLFSVSKYYYWPRFIPKVLVPQIYAVCKKTDSRS